ncbi:hypothetical protein BN874_1450002 [Candidatus Contendobacter odensis Run_B_J11]|uniref:Uncharacterized protein n=1 Tax=Candidatus Contendobacter odensis Run_B_J11 TaxID=1400861 RepID=A0A7U7G8Y8_9GAMM|nr:hypothetical protein BN874_1450002 [Candidatus Contendobacter odensis Run_B_J11]
MSRPACSGCWVRIPKACCKAYSPPWKETVECVEKINDCRSRIHAADGSRYDNITDGSLSKFSDHYHYYHDNIIIKLDIETTPRDSTIGEKFNTGLSLSVIPA